MEEEKKYFFTLGMIVLAITFLIFMRILPGIISWDLIDLLGLIWVVMGLSITFEFLRPQRDKWGTGGMIFHIFIYYSAIYSSILTVLSIINFSIEPVFIISFLNELGIAILGWLGLILYYD